MQLYEVLIEKMSRYDISRLLRRKINFTDTTSLVYNREGITALQEYDLMHYLEGDILTKVDRAAMAQSLETRPPFLDHNFIQLCFSLDPNFRMHGSHGKWIFKEVFKNILPREILRRKKMGFAIPLKEYLTKELSDFVDKYVFNYDKHDLFDRQFIQDLYNKKDLVNIYRIYWNIMMFNMWHERWMVGN